MQMAAWQLLACETIVKTVNEFESAAPELRQVGSACRVDGARDGLRCGQEVWATQEDQPIHIAWEWTEIQPGVVALFDPMNILCNVALVDPSGHTLGCSRRMLHLNNVIHQLDWRATLARRRAGACKPPERATNSVSANFASTSFR